ncbi:MAG: inorganic diphosphatase [Candidatus Aenigmarchaeota archaeon]|nr:inorganic diphosphatase [Candidatus Aenigmarchaeota archaeon]
MNVWHDVELGEKAPEVINVIIEIPKGSQNKYELDKETGLIKLDRVLYSPVFYPTEYGLIPRTLSDDGDPLDALVLVSNPTVPGVLLEAVPIGMLNMIDSGEKDEKILCVAKGDPRFSHIKDLSDVSPHLLKEISHFFSVMKQLQNKKVEVKDWENAKKAKDMIIASQKMYNKKFKK